LDIVQQIRIAILEKFHEMTNYLAPKEDFGAEIDIQSAG
jgi:hypothetical protein